MLNGGSEHPDSLDLVDYVRRRARPREARKIHHHSLVCDRCASEIEALGRLRCAFGLEVPSEMRAAAPAAARVQ